MPLATADRLVGAVVAARAEPLALDALSGTVLSLLGDQLAAGIASAQLRLAAPGRGDRARAAARGGRRARRPRAGPRAGRPRARVPGRRAARAEAAEASRARLRAAVTSAHGVVRDRLVDLSDALPLGGLRAAVEEVCDALLAARPDRSARRRCRVGEAPPAVTAAVVRVLNEALANAAQARRGGVRRRARCAPSRAPSPRVADDGQGFDPPDGGAAEGHLGLALMRAARARRPASSHRVRAGRRHDDPAPASHYRPLHEPSTDLRHAAEERRRAAVLPAHGDARSSRRRSCTRRWQRSTRSAPAATAGCCTARCPARLAADRAGLIAAGLDVEALEAERPPPADRGAGHRAARALGGAVPAADRGAPRRRLRGGLVVALPGRRRRPRVRRRARVRPRLGRGDARPPRRLAVPVRRRPARLRGRRRQAARHDARRRAARRARTAPS